MQENHTAIPAKRRLLSLALAACLLAATALLLPGPLAANAAPALEAGLSDPGWVTVGKADRPDGTEAAGGPDASDVTVLGFGGRTWYVIGYDDAGVYSDPGTMTLLAKDAAGSTTYGSEKNYAGSDLQVKTLSVHAAIDPGEQALILPREFNDTYEGTPITDQPLWPLSRQEAMEVSHSVRGIGTEWWLRSYQSSFSAFVQSTGRLASVGGSRSCSLRPALQLELDPDNILFTSDAAGKPSGTGTPVAVEPLDPGTPVKLTVVDRDASFRLSTSLSDLGTVMPGHSEAILFSTLTPGGAGGFVSCIIVDENHNVLYYGKIKKIQATVTNDTYDFTVPSDIPDGDYTVKFFQEVDNGANKTDFAGETVDIPMTVARPVQINDIDFGTLPEDYTPPAAQFFQITNNAGIDVHVFSAAVNTSGPDGFDRQLRFLVPGTVFAGETKDFYEIQPKAGLPKGTYTLTVKIDYTISGSTLSATATARFTVGDPASARGSWRSSSGGSSTPDGPAGMTTLPASAFSWDDDHTLTIDHDQVTALGLLSVQWDGKALMRGAEYSVYRGSVIIRFDEDFIADQPPGEHTVQVDFLNHTGKATVTVAPTGAAVEPGAQLSDPEPLDPETLDPETHNPNTGAGTPATPAAALLAGGILAAGWFFFRQERAKK